MRHNPSMNWPRSDLTREPSRGASPDTSYHGLCGMERYVNTFETAFAGKEGRAAGGEAGPWETPTLTVSANE
jgi:hypothetical protein